jgi:prepilin-type processing-associated H-X9-DG protein
VGADAATLPVGSPRSGAFHYDSPTPFAAITDGLSQTLLFGETRSELSPWLRGGPGTVRGLIDAPGAPPLIGEQFGGYFPSGANFAMCDGSVRMFSPRTTPRVLLGLATIAGKETDPVPGE